MLPVGFAHPILTIVLKNILRTFEVESLKEHSASAQKLDVLVKKSVQLFKKVDRM